MKVINWIVLSLMLSLVLGKQTRFVIDNFYVQAKNYEFIKFDGLFNPKVNSLASLAGI